MATTLSSTTLASAAAVADGTLNLASVSGIEVGYILFCGRTAYEVTAIGGTRCSVVKGVLGTRPEAYPSGKRVWIAEQYDLALSRKAGTGDPANEVVLPRIVVGPSGPVIQDLVGNAENGYVWVTVADEPPTAKPRGVYNYTEPGAIQIADGVHQLSGNGADAMTLAAPAIQDAGKRLLIIATTANAFTVDVTGAAAGSGENLNTFGGAVGDGFEVVAGNDAKWYTLALNGVTPS